MHSVMPELPVKKVADNLVDSLGWVWDAGLALREHFHEYGYNDLRTDEALVLLKDRLNEALYDANRYHLSRLTLNR